MAATKRKAHASIVSPELASWRDLVVTTTVLTTTGRSVPVLYCPFDLRVKAVTFVQESDAAGTAMTVKIRNETQSTDITSTLDIAALGALEGGVIPVSAAGAALRCEAGDILTLVHAVTAGSGAPDECQVVLDIERLDT